MGFVSRDKGSTLRLMTSRSGKFGAAFRITRDERAQLAEELMASIDRDDDDEDEELGWRPAREEIELLYADEADELPPASEDRWQNGPLRLTRSS